MLLGSIEVKGIFPINLKGFSNLFTIFVKVGFKSA